MSQDDAARAFAIRAHFDQPQLLGARWWRSGIEVAQRTESRRSALKLIVGLGGAVLGLGVIVRLLAPESPSPSIQSGAGSDPFDGSFRPGDRATNAVPAPAVMEEALSAQRALGWDVGASPAEISFPDAVAVDSLGGAFDPAVFVDLPARLQPAQGRLRPFYVPTLFQVTDQPASASFCDRTKPIKSAAMQVAFDRGEAVRTLFAGATGAPDTALVVDLPGPEAVAFAAALTSSMPPVFTFDNWPHPRGVVPSHLTLAAALYYLPDFAAATQESDAAPVFVLDRNRLNPYGDSSERFDNRYVAKLPSAAALKELGVKHVLYVCPKAASPIESDDLNDDFVAWRAGGIELRALPMTDLIAGTAGGPATAAQAATQPQPARPGQPIPAPVPVPEPAQTPAPTAAPADYRADRIVHYYYWGGSPYSHPWFWRSYSWRPVPRWAYPTPPVFVPSGYDYVPAPRRTLFSSGTYGTPSPGPRPKPTGFGRVSVRPPSQGGPAVPYRPSNVPPPSAPRSGSVNRTTGWSSSGS